MVGTCDCCGKQDTDVSFVLAYGIETYACNACKGIEDAPPGDLLSVLLDIARAGARKAS